MKPKLTSYFTPGPVEMPPEICAITGEQIPYFRNSWFSRIVRECEEGMLKLVGAPSGSRVLLLTCSGTGGMEAALANFADPRKPTLVINSQGFGQRLVDICRALGRPVREVRLNMGKAFRPHHMSRANMDGVTLVAAQAHDTISGVLHDVAAISELAKQTGALLAIDAISSFLCDPLNMERLNIDIVIISSQKALALAPGLAMLVLSPRAVEILSNPDHAPGTYYFNLVDALANAERGQTPFTPAVGIVMQLHARLRQIQREGLENVIAHTAHLAHYFRKKIMDEGLPFRIFPDIPSNAITALECTDKSMNAREMVQRIADEHGLFLTPNGGELGERVFRVSHMGEQTVEALDNLIDVLSAYVEEHGNRGRS